MVELEQYLELDPSASGAAAPPEALLLQRTLRCGMEEHVYREPLLCLSRQRLEYCLRSALARTHRQGAQIEWLGAYDMGPWSEDAGRTLLLLR
jgi:hypothetical protein